VLKRVQNYFAAAGLRFAHAALLWAAEVPAPRPSFYGNYIRPDFFILAKQRISGGDMGEVAMQKLLDAAAKMGKLLGVGESVGRIWGFLLLKSRPVTQKEIEEGTGYSRGLISQCLKEMEERTVIFVEREGREKHYSINPTLATSYGEVVGRQYEERMQQVIEFLSEFADSISDEKARESLRSIRDEYKKVSIAFLLTPRIIALINGTDLELTEVNEVAKRISLRIDKEEKEEEA
jgi:DNA-binding transcriptional regulator GbsR (MarR family)